MILFLAVLVAISTMASAISIHDVSPANQALEIIEPHWLSDPHIVVTPEQPNNQLEVEEIIFKQNGVEISPNELPLGKEIELDVKIKNNYPKSFQTKKVSPQNGIVQGLQVHFIAQSEEWNFGAKSKTKTMLNGESNYFTTTFTIPLNTVEDQSNLKLLLIADDMVKQISFINTKEVSTSIDRKDDELRIIETDFNPSVIEDETTKEVQLTVSIINTGSNEQDNVVIKVSSRNADIDFEETRTIANIQTGETVTKVFFIDLPDRLKNDDYQFKVKASSNSCSANTKYVSFTKDSEEGNNNEGNGTNSNDEENNNNSNSESNDSDVIVVPGGDQGNQSSSNDDSGFVVNPDGEWSDNGQSFSPANSSSNSFPLEVFELILVGFAILAGASLLTVLVVANGQTIGDSLRSKKKKKKLPFVVQN